MLEKIEKHLDLGFLLALSFFLRLPSLFEPYHYGDEGIYEVLGQAVSQGGLLYRDAWDNKPPFLYLIYAVFSGDLFWVKFLSLVFCLLTITVFYLLARKIFTSGRLALLSTLIFTLLFSLPFLEGNIANAENFMLLPIIFAFYLVFRYFPKSNRFHFLSAGFLLGLAFLLKIVAIFDFAALGVFLLIGLWDKIFPPLKSNKIFKKLLNFKPEMVFPLLFLFGGFILPIIATFMFFFFQGSFKDFLTAAFSQNANYVAAGNQLFIPQGWLLFKLLLLAIFCLFLLLKRGSFTKGQLLIFLWFGFSVFNALFAERPWIHYLLVLIPALSLLLLFPFQEKKWRRFTLAIIIFTFYLIGSRFWLYGKTFTYYENFFSLIAGKKSVEDYYSFWGNHVNRDYQVAQFLMAKNGGSDPIFIWGDNAQIYALAKKPVVGRYSVAYHITFYPQAYQETIEALSQKQPRYIIILLPQTAPLKDIGVFISQHYRLLFQTEGFIVYEKQL
ncbi:glycosyltransferase family 39 protein [Candidatus Microgenomates bacterium]|nr:glycosyltransferase family 39 protein [Candidatus Microgenomates bacterium]